MRVLVTGGGGFIGSHVVRAARDAGFEVAVLDDFSTGKRENVPEGVRVFTVDLRDRDAVLGALADFKPQAVSHQAAQASVPISVKNPLFDAQVNIIGGINLLDACTAPGSQVERFVFASTGGAIYGEVAEAAGATEQHALRPKAPYGISKLYFENLLGAFQEFRGLPSTVLRYANVYGPRQDPHGEAGVVAIFFDAARAGKPLKVFAMRQRGDGGCVRDYVYVGDAARANLAALTNKLADPVVNVGTGRTTSTLELAQTIVRLTGSSSSIEQGDVRQGDILRSLLSIGRFERALGPATSLEEGLGKTAEWYAAS